MAEGIEVEVRDGFAHIQFLDREKAGPAIAKLLELGGPELSDIDTRSNPRKTYIVPEGTARDAGLLDDSESGSETPAEPEPVALPEGEPSESWTVVQLKEYAAREEISLAGADKKADILAAVRAASQPVSETPSQE
jgi:hypothetical protein